MLVTDEKYQLPPDFLMDMMELNEMLPELPEGETRQRIKSVADSLDDGIKPYLQQAEHGADTGRSLEKLKEYYYKKKYLKRILDRLGD